MWSRVQSHQRLLHFYLHIIGMSSSSLPSINTNLGNLMGESLRPYITMICNCCQAGKSVEKDLKVFADVRKLQSTEGSLQRKSCLLVVDWSREPVKPTAATFIFSVRSIPLPILLIFCLCISPDRIGTSALLHQQEDGACEMERVTTPPHKESRLYKGSEFVLNHL